MNERREGDIEMQLHRPELLLPLAERAVASAKRAGADFVDATVSISRELSITVEKSSIKTAELVWSKQVSVRVYVAGGMGYASGSILDPGDIEDLSQKAVALARLATPDPDFVALPEPQQSQHVPDTFDPQVLVIGPDDAIRWATENIQSGRSVYRDVILSGDVGISASAGALASSTGIRIARNSTSVDLGFFAVIKNGANVGSFADHDSARFMSDFNPDGIAAKVTQRALSYQNARKAKTQKTTLVLGPLPAYGLFGSIAGAANAESMQRRRSIFADRLNTVIGSTLLTISDDGLISKGLYSGAYDGEGAVRNVVKIVEGGRFTGALHNSYTANKAKVPNTGHGLRTGGVGYTNLQIGLGEKTAQELISEVEDGIYLELGGLDPDLVSGDISTNLDFAFKIEKGELTYPLANTMVAGDFIEMLKNIDAVSVDYRYEPGIYMPTIRIRDVQISSEGQP
jgi:PmbA protein